MDDDLVDHALVRILDDIRIGEWATGEVDKRLKREGPQDHEFWTMYTAVTNELLDCRSANTSRREGKPVQISGRAIGGGERGSAVAVPEGLGATAGKLRCCSALILTYCRGFWRGTNTPGLLAFDNREFRFDKLFR